MQAGIVSSGTEISSCPLIIETNHFHMYTEIFFFFFLNLKSVNGIRIKTSKRCKRQEKKLFFFFVFF